MCGIAGEFLLEGRGAIEIGRIVPMIAALEHRGPDEWGYYVDPSRRGALLHTRLSIVDLAGGRQPLCNEDGSVWVICNGEIYGFADLARDLAKRGHRFRTRTDTEVIVHLYEEYGDDFVRYLRGEFAFALYDRRKLALYLGRDRFGIKPLYYMQTDNSVIFASEAKAILRHPDTDVRPDRRTFYRFLSGVLTPTDTIFHGIKQVEAGCYLKVANGIIRRIRYWDLNFPRSGEPDLAGCAEQELIEEFHRLFVEAVRLRLHGDVEVGTYLSGGIDSAAVTVTAAQLSGHPVKAFSIGFKNADYDETRGAAALAREHGLDHQIVPVGPGDLAPHFARSLWHSEMPVFNAHGTAKMLLSELASKQVKVVLSGEGSDEILAGYAIYRHMLLLEAVRNDPKDREARAALNRFLRTDGILDGVIRSRLLPDYDTVVKMFGAYPYSALRSRIARKYLAPVLDGGFREEMHGDDALADVAAAFDGPGLSGLTPLTASQYTTIRTDLPNYNLNYLGDRQEMVNSIEGRLPFLDHVLADFCCRLPVSMVIDGEHTKVILRRAMAASLPESAATPKKAFLAPSQECLALGVGNPIVDAHFEPDRVRKIGMFNPRVLSLLRRDARIMPHGSHWRGVWENLLTTALSIHMLHDLFFNGFHDNARHYAQSALDYSLDVGKQAVS
ncbi:MAG: asparagine synthase (glutamine-hydrolyzing) [Woeseia sp.]